MPFSSRPGTVKIARMLGAHRQHHRVKSLAQILERRFTHVRIGDELDAFGRHLLQAPVDPVLLHLEIRNAVAQQSADAVGFLKHRHRVPGARQLLRRRQPRRTRSRPPPRACRVRISRRLRHESSPARTRDR